MFPTLFGIEIEVLGLGNYYDRRHITSQFNKIGAADFLAYDEDDYGWRIQEDCSVKNCEDHEHDTADCCDDCHIEEGVEFVSPPLPLNVESFELVKGFINTLNDLNAYINPTCGLHVHIDASFVDSYQTDEEKRKFFAFVRKLYLKHEDTFDSRMSDRRRMNRNQYCMSFKYATPDYIERLRIGRYYKLNTESYFRHGTIEFRHHHGTLNANEVIDWVKTCGLFIAFARQEYENQKAEAAPLAVAV